MADAVLVENLQKQLDRLMNQLSDIEEEKPNMDTQEYEELKSETMEELKVISSFILVLHLLRYAMGRWFGQIFIIPVIKEDLSRSLEKMTGGNITSTDNLTATRMAVRAAISQALRTPAILGLFARKQPIALRQRLILSGEGFCQAVLFEYGENPSNRIGLVRPRFTTDLMDCSEWDQAAGSVTPAPVTLCSPRTSTLDESEEMDVYFTEDFRHIRRTSYDQDVIGPELRFDEEQNLLERVLVVIPYRVLYELDRLKKTSSISSSPIQLPQKASRVVKMLCNLRGSSLIYWESSAESYEEVDGFVASSSEDINDDYVLKCAYRIKSMHVIVDSRGENWDTVFVTNDQLLSLKAHASGIPCINVKEAKEILKNKDCSPSTTLCQANFAVPTRNTNRPTDRPPITKRHEEKWMILDNLAKRNPLATFSQIWKLLVNALRKRSQTCPDKSKTDANRLRECAYIFCRNQTEENLSLLARMTCWLYSYYFPQRTESGNTNYKALMRNGLHKELCCSSCKSRKLMKELHVHSRNWEGHHGETKGTPTAIANGGRNVTGKREEDD
ncbi:unnamed protein product [Angiostrongylus costaricensis]|uniref:PINc domain-containing protein n=1 Tax=Angiostrongylus costaricensis TaxID=334426 RepID=A0A158PDE0_ANGCS|nr:unnamed protein product [Angiostrongylus costaricensis]